MSNEEPLFIHERYGFSFKVYRNRIDIVERQFIGTKKTTTHLLRQVASVEVKPIGGKLILVLTDNKKHEYIIGTQADEARQAIVSVLP